MTDEARMLVAEIDGRLVVAKRAATLAARAALAAEADRLRRAQHPGVVRIVAETASPGGGFATAWAGSRTLGQGCDDPIVLARLVSIVADTLAELHERGVIHGRLAPSHVIIGPDGQPVLCGFGPTDPDPCTAPNDVAGLGNLLLAVTAAPLELDPLPTSRWRRPPRADGAITRAIQMLADQASDADPARRPSARALAASLRSLAGDDTAGGGSGEPLHPLWRGRLLGWLVVAALGGVALWAGHGALPAPSLRALLGPPPTDAATATVAVVRVAGILVAAGLIASLLIDGCGRALHVPAAVTVARALRGGIRRPAAASGALAASVLAAIVPLDRAEPVALAAASATGTTPSMDPAPTSAPPGIAVEDPPPTAPQRPPEQAPPNDGRPIAGPAGVPDRPDASADGPAARTPWTVRPGDHLWAIATDVAQAARPDATDDDVARYWRRLIVANPQLTDPDLIVPGQVLEVPPW